MAHGKLDRRHFMEDIRGLTREIVEKVRNFRGETIEGEHAVIDAKCPNCGSGPIKEDYKTFRCQNCDWLMWKTMASRQFEPEEVRELLTKERVGPLQGFRSKMGRPFEAAVKLGEDKSRNLICVMEMAHRKGSTPPGMESIGMCPVCKEGRVYELDNATLHCERAATTPRKCTFRLSKNDFAARHSERTSAKIDVDGEDRPPSEIYLERGRPFSAHLKLDDGKVGFEFAEKSPRTAKPRARKSAKT